MLKELYLTNIILIESSQIAFAPGFNVLSGESGSGKSAIMNALNLIAGDRCDATVLRRGADKGSVEAIFDIENLAILRHFLDESGIEHESGSELIIRREISQQGKNRAFLNHQPVQLSLLRTVAAYLFTIVGQHANQKLLTLDYHRQTIDLYGELKNDIDQFEESWKEENRTRVTLQELTQSEMHRMREIERCRAEIEELEAGLFQVGEEEELFAEYTLLTHADELRQKVEDIQRLFYGEKTPVLALLNRQKSTLLQLTHLAPELKEVAASYENALVELDEVAHSLTLFSGRIDNRPERLDQLNDRLEVITRLKKKYGSTAEEVNGYLKETKDRLFQLENVDERIEELTVQLDELVKKTHLYALNLTEKRKGAAKRFGEAVMLQLQALNMSKAEFCVSIITQKRSHHGDDKIEFLLKPNVGEGQISLRECASGGELSRVMLAIQVVLGNKEQIPTLVFDEIDSNIGGSTAAVIGEKMCEMGQQHQVLCITHFSQVAKQAAHHLQISKVEIEGRTLSMICCLTEQTREAELLRMEGRAAFRDIANL